MYSHKNVYYFNLIVYTSLNQIFFTQTNSLNLFAGNPQSLVRTVWMNNTLHFGLRSREEHTTLRWGDIQMKATTDGGQYLEHTERITKTRNGANLDTRAFQAKMFADTGNVSGKVL